LGKKQVGLHYDNLDRETRAFMVSEIRAGGLYRGPRLNGVGVRRWPLLLEEAARWHNDDWLGRQLTEQGLIGDSELNLPWSGRRILESIKVKISATLLAEEEFNRFYLRGLCVRAIQSGIPSLEIYCGKDAAQPTQEFEERIGASINAEALLRALRCKKFVSLEQSVFGISANTSSGLTARLPQAPISSATADHRPEAPSKGA
jgi:hypothetical protein